MHFYATFLVVFSSLEHVQLACARDTPGLFFWKEAELLQPLGTGLCRAHQAGSERVSTQFGKQRFFLRGIVASLGCERASLRFPRPPGSTFVLHQSQEQCYKNVCRQQSRACACA